MKKIFVVLTLMIMVGLAQANLLTNPGFEAGTYSTKGMPDSWYVYEPSLNSSGESGWTWHSTGGIGGGKMIQINSAQSYYSYTTYYVSAFVGQWVSAGIVEGDLLEFSVWTKNAAGNGAGVYAWGYYTFWDSSSVDFSWGWLGYDVVAYNDWTEVTFPTFFVPAGAASVTMWLTGYSANWAGGGIQHDDASLIVVPEPITMGLLGLGALMLRRRKKA